MKLKMMMKKKKETSGENENISPRVSSRNSLLAPEKDMAVPPMLAVSSVTSDSTFATADVVQAPSSVPKGKKKGPFEFVSRSGVGGFLNIQHNNLAHRNFRYGGFSPLCVPMPLKVPNVSWNPTKSEENTTATNTSSNTNINYDPAASEGKASFALSSTRPRANTLNLDLDIINRGRSTTSLHGKRSFNPQSPTSPSQYQIRTKTRLSTDSLNKIAYVSGVRTYKDFEKQKKGETKNVN